MSEPTIRDLARAVRNIAQLGRPTDEDAEALDRLCEDGQGDQAPEAPEAPGGRQAGTQARTKADHPRPKGGDK